MSERESFLEKKDEVASRTEIRPFLKDNIESNKETNFTKNLTMYNKYMYNTY